MATDYFTLKVPELKKLCSERGLSPTGNKADLVARLKEHDEANGTAEPQSTEKESNQEANAEAAPKEDLISYSDDEAPAAKPAPVEAAAATADAATANPSASNPEETKVPEGEPAAPATEEAKPEPVSFAAGLAASSASDEAKKRADRAKRFGIEEDEEKKKLAERAERFGVQEDAVSGLDSALPDRPLKRGRGRNAEADNARPNKRQSQDRRGGRRDGRRGGADAPTGNKPAAAMKSSILNDPVEKAKAEKRAARFGGA
ncbi:uncharacterized protein J7T54_000735 [Emericellopsis cladophorae]|uniref:SAP domain-containing protein n=1 Tax=Emericellopsis cladophorae TaxID=2686198 RepID=A0A9P9Y525_9HYPO|nr:uncharacterized protein J7T54_000735 [Emericellopsis cladophorae]KAI6783233.1 hypothetical protein J7T54_000735 [Emericellopsis cladophorae]